MLQPFWCTGRLRCVHPWFKGIDPEKVLDFPNTVRQLLVDVRKEAGEAKSYQIQLHGKELSSELEVPRSPRGSTDLLNRVHAQFGAAKGACHCRIGPPMETQCGPDEFCIVIHNPSGPQCIPLPGPNLQCHALFAPTNCACNWFSEPVDPPHDH